MQVNDTQTGFSVKSFGLNALLNVIGYFDQDGELVEYDVQRKDNGDVVAAIGEFREDIAKLGKVVHAHRSKVPADYALKADA